MTSITKIFKCCVITLALGSAISASLVTSIQANDLVGHSLDDILNREYVGEVPKEFSQYDFFIGKWDVFVDQYKDGEVVDTGQGVWWAKYIHDKRDVLDDIVISDGKGKLYPGYPSLRTYSVKGGHWVSMHMAPLATQAMCTNIGNWKNNEMHIDSTCKRADGSLQSHHRVRFYNIKDDS